MNATAQAWKNWSGSVQAQPSRLASPRTEDELSTIVRGAAKVRVVGAGHSFMPLCATTGVLLSLADLDSPIEVAADGTSAWVPAGWSLKRSHSRAQRRPERMALARISAAFRHSRTRFA